ncbi:MAG: antirestriction protein [Alphaproteobacteria bacterium]|nr:MAG: antirestriction protein [Caulobacteraceae bacterium]TPW07348.1 MAG: antirestriction protein [Alphaproteobacteria bacterium]
MTRTTGTNAARRDIASDITQALLAELDRGVMPWRKPWDAARVSGGDVTLPRRVTGEPYRGINVVLLWSAAAAHGYASPTWLTFRQAHACGGQVRSGEKGQIVVYYGRAQRTRIDGAGVERDDSFRFLKSFVVFNTAQIAGLPERFHPAPAVDSAQPILPRDYEAWFARFGVPRIATADLACYWPGRDAIGMPAPAAFDTIEHYQATELHEIGHMSGHPARLNRDMRRYGVHMIAAEELVAEIFSAIAGTYFQLSPTHLHDHASYIASWIRLLKDDKRAFFAAAAKAQAAVDWMLTVNPPPGVETRTTEACHVAA